MTVNFQRDRHKKIIPTVIIILLFVLSTANGQSIPEQILDYLEQVRNEAGAPGISVAVAVKGKIIFSGGVGYAELDNLTLATGKTVHNIASISKTHAAVAVMQLVEQGKVDLDNPVQDYVPYFPEKRWKITVRHILTHTSGIRHYRPDDFGPQRKVTKKFPEVHMANAFVGNMLRLEILSRYGRCQQILDESIDYFLYMADRTGTLWENVGAYASCNHGFASHVAHMLYRDVLGLHRIDPVNKVVDLRFGDLRLNWCEGRIPINGDAVYLRWWEEGERIDYTLTVPAGYTVQVENLSGKQLTRR